LLALLGGSKPGIGLEATVVFVALGLLIVFVGKTPCEKTIENIFPKKG
jgi:hypothetical protein